MSLQYDSIAGLDLSSLTTVSQSQLMQAINQIGPLSNIGGVLAFDGDSNGAAGIGFPDVVNNPRFVRYLWLDTQVRSSPSVKRYRGSYNGTPADPNSISNRYVDWASSTGGGGSGSVLQEIIYYPYQLDPTILLNSITKYIEYSQTGGFPQVIQGKIQCIVADLDYSIGDEINVESVGGIYPAAVFPAFNIFRYISAGVDYKIRLSWPEIFAVDLLVLRKDRTAVVVLDTSKWAPILYLYQ